MCGGSSHTCVRLWGLSAAHLDVDMTGVEKNQCLKLEQTKVLPPLDLDIPGDAYLGYQK